MRRKKILFVVTAVVLIAASVLPVPIVSGEYDPWKGYNENREAMYGWPGESETESETGIVVSGIVLGLAVLGIVVWLLYRKKHVHVA